ncbi:Pyruvate dehydrogenase E1 component [Streptomyces murinus]
MSVSARRVSRKRVIGARPPVLPRGPPGNIARHLEGKGPIEGEIEGGGGHDGSAGHHGEQTKGNRPCSSRCGHRRQTG